MCFGFVGSSDFKVTQNMVESCLTFSLSNHAVSIYFLLVELLLHITLNLFLHCHVFCSVTRH